MVVKSLNCLFIHIPKCAGTSIEKSLCHHASTNWEGRSKFLIKKNLDPLCGPPQLGHLTLREYLKYNYVKNIEEYFKFSFVRNPWARLVSEYRYRKYYQVMDFREFVNRISSYEDDYENCKDFKRHLISQVDFLVDEKGALSVDFIGKFENLESDYKKVCEHLGVKYNLRKTNVSQNKKNILLQVKKIFNYQSKYSYNYKDYYDSNLKNDVSQIYEKDIDIFKYAF